MATINNSTSNTLLSGTSGDDEIANGGYWYEGSSYYTYHYGGSNVTINTGAGNDSVDNYYGDSVTINTGAGDDYVDNDGNSVTINTGDGDDTVKNYSSSVTINTGAGDDYVDNDYSDSVTINTGAGDDYVDNDGNSVTINTGDGNDSVDNFECSKVTINTGSGNDSVRNYGSKVTINTGAGNDTIFNNCYREYDGSIYYFDDNYGSKVVFKYAAGDGYDTIWGFKADSTLSIGGGSYSTTTSGDDVIVTVGDGKISLVGAASLSKLNIKGTSGGGSSETNSWKLSGTTATYGTSSNTLITITGIKSLDGISLSGKTITIANASLNQQTVSISDGYTLEADYDVPLSTTTAAGWSLSGSTATYKNAKTTAGYQLVNNQLVYKADSGGDTLVTVSGVKAADGLSLSGKTVTVAASALNKAKVTLSGSGYKLKLANDVSTTATTSNAWSYKSSVATLKQTKGAAYTLASDGKSISYSAGTSKTLVTVSGVKSADGLSLSGKTVTVAASALNKAKVTLSGSGYKLKLANDVSTTATTSNDWSYKSSVATLKQTKGAAYSLASDGKSISYSAGTSKTLVTVSGVKSADGLSLSGKTVTVAASALNKSKVTLSGSGYKLKLGNDVSTTAKAKTDWNYKSSVATLKQTKGAAYTLASDGKSISYSAGTSKNLAKVGGLTSASGLKVSNKVISVPNAIIDSNRKVSVNGSGYEFKFAAKKTLITGSKNADIITSTGANSTINAGKGNDTINISGANNVIVYKSGDGSDTITNYSAENTINIASGAAQVTKSGSDIVFNVGNGSITLKDAANKTVTYYAGGTQKTYSASSAKPYTVSKDGKSVTLSSSYSEKKFYANNITNGEKIVTIDASAVTYKLNIKGNSLANKIIGGKAGGTLDGGKGGNDTLIGGDGADIFIYFAGDGKDVISGYDAKDTIKIGKGEVGTIKPSREDVVFQVGDGELTVQDVEGTHISFIEDGIEYGCLDGKRTLDISQTKNDTIATLSKNYRKDSFDATKIGNEDVGNSITKIHAAAVSRTLKITGNSRANEILGSSTKSNTITGGGGDDTLQGGDGADVFVYAAGDGNDFITSYDKSDKISITSGTVDNVSVNADNAIVLTIGANKIILDNAGGKKLTYYDDAHRKDAFSKIISPSDVVDNLFVADDDNFAVDNDLSALVQSNSTDYSLAEVETSLTSANALQTLTCSSKK